MPCTIYIANFSVSNSHVVNDKSPPLPPPHTPLSTNTKSPCKVAQWKVNGFPLSLIKAP